MFSYASYLPPADCADFTNLRNECERFKRNFVGGENDFSGDDLIYARVYWSIPK